jgi:uncharacterized protein YukE
MINKQQITEITDQIRNTKDPESLKLIIADHTGSLKELTASVSKVQADILKDILPILSLPSPTPPSIVSWLGKLVAGVAAPQLKAQVKLTVQLGELTSALADVAAAVREAQAALSDVTGELKDLADELQGDLGAVINDLATTAASSLSDIGTAQTALNDIAGTTVSSFDTSSIANLSKSADTELVKLDENVSSFIKVELP